MERCCSTYTTQKTSKKNDAIKLINKYDYELNEKDLTEVLNFLRISRIEFFEIVDSHRNEEIWRKKGNKIELINKLKI